MLGNPKDLITETELEKANGKVEKSEKINWIYYG